MKILPIEDFSTYILFELQQQRKSHFDWKEIYRLGSDAAGRFFPGIDPSKDWQALARKCASSCFDLQEKGLLEVLTDPKLGLIRMVRVTREGGSLLHTHIFSGQHTTPVAAQEE